MCLPLPLCCRYSKIDFVRYGFTALLVNQFKGKPQLRYNGQSVLHFYGVNGESEWANLGYLTLFFFGFSFLTFNALKYVRHDRR
jgi:hypothetical protein